MSWDQATGLNNSLEDLDDLLFLGFNGNQWEIIPASVTTNLLSDNEVSSLTACSLISDNSIDLGLYEALAYTLPLGGEKNIYLGLKVSANNVTLNAAHWPPIKVLTAIPLFS